MLLGWELTEHFNRTIISFKTREVNLNLESEAGLDFSQQIEGHRSLETTESAAEILVQKLGK